MLAELKEKTPESKAELSTCALEANQIVITSSKRRKNSLQFRPYPLAVVSPVMPYMYFYFFTVSTFEEVIEFFASILYCLQINKIDPR